MTTGKPTKAQVVAALNIPPVGPAKRLFTAEEAAEALVRAGLVEEPREEGWYWVKWESAYNPKTDWTVRQWTELGWADCRNFPTPTAPSVIGPRIKEPEE